MTRTCPVCGTEFTPTCNRQRYCSRRCYVLAAERYARRKELTKAEHKLAQRIYEEDHSYRCVAVNW